MIVTDLVEAYLDELMPIKDPLLKEIQEEGLKQEIPIIQVPSLRLIQLLLNIVKPAHIIEIGTAIGFSAIWMAQAAPNAIIHTIERKPQMVEQARKNIEKAGLDRIKLYHGDALDILPTLPKSQFIFIDAAKGKYMEFYQLSLPLLEDGGLILFDNIFFRGYIADESIYSTKPMLRKIRKFNDFLANQEEMETSFIPIGDGLAICYKAKDEDNRKTEEYHAGP